jgi:hypothetical protein
MIILASTFRFVLDTSSIILNVFGDQAYSLPCPDLQDSSRNIEFQIAQQILITVLTHYLLIFIILRIYNLE